MLYEVITEFDVSEHLVEGMNKLAVQVIKWTAGSWCEDQDFFRFSGIFRDVFLYCIPEVHIRDLKICTPLTEDFKQGKLDVITSYSIHYTKLYDV